MNKTYIALEFNNQDLNIETIYFTENYLKGNVVNPATQKSYTDDELKNLKQAALTAPENGYIAISSYVPSATLWFNEEDAKKIVTYTDALTIKDNKICTLNGDVVATAICYLKDIVLDEKNLTALHTSLEVNEGVLHSVKTEKIEEDDTNSYVTLNDFSMKNGVIECDVKSVLLPDSPELARGFIGIAFRIDEKDMEFEGFYIRPTNGRGCENAFRKAHACQYFAYPGYIWSYYREFEITDYEAPIDTIALDEWAHIKAILIDDTAKFYVNDELVLDVKHMQHTPQSGRIGFNTHIGSDCYFKNLKVEVLD